MQEADQAWQRLQARHGHTPEQADHDSALSATLSGVRPETADQITTPLMRESRLNPRNAGGTQGAGGPGGMMPPMMMGGAGAAGGATAAAASSRAAAGAAPNVAANGASAAGASSGNGLMPGMVEARQIQQASSSGGGAYGGGAMVPSGRDGSSAGVMAAGADDIPTPEEAALRDELVVDAPGADDTPDADGTARPREVVGDPRLQEPTLRERQYGPEADDHRTSFDVERLRSTGGGWRLLAEDMANAMHRMPAPASLGFASTPQADTDALVMSMKGCAQQAAAEFEQIAQRLDGAAGAYDEREQDNAALAAEVGQA